MEEIALNMTVLKRWDGCRIWYPNSLINVVPILNITRSENKWEFFKVWVVAAYKLSESLFLCVSAEDTLHRLLYPNLCDGMTLRCLTVCHQRQL